MSADKRGNKAIAISGNDAIGTAVSRYDWKVWSGSGFGKRIASALNGREIQCEVTDLGRYVVIKAQRHNSATGKSESKTFCVVFDDLSGAGTIWATSTKFRTIGSVDQAISYIRGVVGSYASGAY